MTYEDAQETVLNLSETLNKEGRNEEARWLLGVTTVLARGHADTRRLETLEALLANIVSENSGEWGEVLLRFDNVHGGIDAPCYYIGTCPGVGSVCETHYKGEYKDLRVAIDAVAPAATGGDETER